MVYQHYETSCRINSAGILDDNCSAAGKADAFGHILLDASLVESGINAGLL